MVETPVLYITFARPEYAARSFEAIRNAKPKKLYFYSNKARADRPDEVARNEAVRSFVAQVDWGCEIKTWFRDEYVDVFTSIWGAIDWIFSNEEKAVVIEEDVVASLAFFDYIDKLIDRYETEERVWMLSGNNAAPQFNPDNLSFFPTRHGDIYGWASWRSRWQSLDRTLSFWPAFRNSKLFHSYYDTALQRILERYYFNCVYKSIETYNPWDFIFMCNMARNRSYVLMPCANLSMDIGAVGANHDGASDNHLSRLGYEGPEFVISSCPETIEPTDFDRRFFFSNRFLGMLKRKAVKLKKIIRR